MKFNLQNEIIDILTNDSINYKEIVVKLAKRDPNLLYAIVTGDDRNEFETFIYNVYKNNKVGGVKEIRAKYGLGLKESVEFFNETLYKFEGSL